MNDWPLQRGEKIRVFFSDKTSAQAAFSLKHDGNQWVKDEKDSLFKFEFERQDDRIKFSIDYARIQHTGDYWCETVSRRRTLPSKKVRLVVEGMC